MKKKKVEYDIKPKNTTRGKWKGDSKYKQDLQWKVQAYCVLQLDPTFFNAQLYTSLAKKNKTSNSSCELLL
jgi:hypothetical protein